MGCGLVSWQRHRPQKTYRGPNLIREESTVLRTLTRVGIDASLDEREQRIVNTVLAKLPLPSHTARGRKREIAAKQLKPDHPESINIVSRVRESPCNPIRCIERSAGNERLLCVG